MKIRFVFFSTGKRVKAYLVPQRIKRKASYIICFENGRDLKSLSDRFCFKCALYVYKDAYYIKTHSKKDALVAAEFGAMSDIGENVLSEHARLLSDDDGLYIVRRFF